MVTTFESQNDSSAVPFEAQAVGSDSGGSVFYNQGTDDSPEWVLAGILNETIVYPNQPRTYAVYGNSTTFADLSYYNRPYKLSICDIMRACGAYSTLGDVNLDGTVTGDGTGPAQIDDVTAFVAGWRHNNHLGRGDYETWIRGDLNLDGATNVQDFLLLRGALNEPIDSRVLASLFATVPEPSATSLALLTNLVLVIKARRRPSQFWRA
jgi:hypothetical protein